MKSCKITYTLLYFFFQGEPKQRAQRTQVQQKLESDHPGLQKHPKQQSWVHCMMRHRDCSEGHTELLFSCFGLLFFLGCGGSSGWSGWIAGGDGGDARQLPGGGGVPTAGAAQGIGPLQQELPHPAVPPAEGRAEEPAGGPDWPGGRRVAAESGAGPEGLSKTESLSPCLLRLWSLKNRPCEFLATTFTQSDKMNRNIMFRKHTQSVSEMSSLTKWIRSVLNPKILSAEKCFI